MAARKRDGTLGRSTSGYRQSKPGEWVLREGWRWPDAPCAKGHNAPRTQFNHCAQCVREYRKSKDYFRKRGPDGKIIYEKLKNAAELAALYRRRNPDRRMLAAARKTAKAQGLPCNLELKDIVVPLLCPALGIPIKIEPGPRKDYAPSLDRIIPSLGYVKGNVVVVSWRANRIKADASVEELSRVAAYYAGLVKKRDHPMR